MEEISKRKVYYSLAFFALGIIAQLGVWTLFLLDMVQKKEFVAGVITIGLFNFFMKKKLEKIKEQLTS